MNEDFARTLSLLRQEKGESQRKVAQALGVSQALLSHYENGIREPGLSFVRRAFASGELRRSSLSCLRRSLRLRSLGESSALRGFFLNAI